MGSGGGWLAGARICSPPRHSCVAVDGARHSLHFPLGLGGLGTRTLGTPCFWSPGCDPLVPPCRGLMPTFNLRAAIAPCPCPAPIQELPRCWLPSHRYWPCEWGHDPAGPVCSETWSVLHAAAVPSPGSGTPPSYGLAGVCMAQREGPPSCPGSGTASALHARSQLGLPAGPSAGPWVPTCRELSMANMY